MATLLADCTSDVDADIAYLQGIVAASLSFDEVLRFVVPMTNWWGERRIAEAIARYDSAPGTIERDIGDILAAADKWLRKESSVSMQDLETHKRYIALAGLILWARDQKPSASRRSASQPNVQLQRMIDKKIVPQVVSKLRNVFRTLRVPAEESLVWHVSLNRVATAALGKSIPAVKADAARTLFTVDCSTIVWAIIDSGIDATHHAFRDKSGLGCRIKRSFDFTRIREIVSLDNLKKGKAKERIRRLLRRELKNAPSAKEAEEYLQELARSARTGRSIDWELVERLVEIDPVTPPPSSHGTHVAGIIAADKDAAREAAKKTGDKRKIDENKHGEIDDYASGMCPDLYVYDFRVLAPSLKETEFAIIAALQYIRYVNERNSYITIHGANLSLSIRHDVRNYACGRTPVCNECERLVNSGVVVVAAAGNRGYQNFETKEGLYEGYAAFSITDPGNADGVITVGATHRFWPHTYGVSFFSSRGPTGDGRLKPDLVAPGERIRAPLPGNVWGDLDGTSMAAPHVSGAAAMLMARYTELIGQPRRIKQILCQSATDLCRERSFQGHGMLDVLRAFQSI